ncbi:glycosyl hydrolase family 61 [Diaporthe amygdali]|uniref:glycosyl hydrolase family 61 n=1 Tax=Phomopsis amygdali TaxID=1214568 RepID=UPI0022FED79A|nr:glycosyl hydrolase family 61 [Diaporthe amygdali]KAJ0115180.1 glycosyl hydrolase family 61 [Diaporthe amygdali]
MRSTFAGVAAFAATAAAHYNFEALIHNDKVTDPYQFVRQTTNSNSPITDVTSDNFICNQGGLDADIMAKTETQEVAPGDAVGFTINSNLGHPGPLSVYMSKAPEGTDAAAYKGDGDWFKVYELTTSSITAEGLQWATSVGGGINNFTFTLPEDLPAGQYLMRGEHIALHGAQEVGGAQFYIGCAQLTVTGSGAGSPSPTVKIPGVYDGTEDGIVINLYYPAPTSYDAPGPVTWPNACIDHTANYADQTSDGDCTNDDGAGASASTPTATGSGAGASATGAATPTGAAQSSSRPSATGAAGVSGNAAAAQPTTPASSGDESSCTKKRAARRSAKKGLKLMA